MLKQIIRGITELIAGRRGDMIETRQTQHKDNTIMRLITPVDAQQVHAILTTHAEFQDAQAMQSQELLGRLKRDEPEDDMICELEAMIEVAEEDSENLKRIARLFTTEEER